VSTPTDKPGNLVRIAVLLPPEVLMSIERLQERKYDAYGFKNRNRAINTLIVTGLSVHDKTAPPKRRRRR
jgi:hypothetical protein